MRASPGEYGVPRVRRRWCMALSACLAGAGTVGAAAQPAPPAANAALVTDLAGAAVVERLGARHALGLLETLEPRDRLQLGAGARAELVVLQPVARVFRLVGSGRFVLRDGAPVMLEGSGRVVQRDLQGDWRGVRLDGTHLGRASVAMRGPPDSTVPLRAPLGQQRPAQLTGLHWDRPAGRRAAQWSYEVRVIDADGVLVFATRTRDTVVALPPLAWTPERDYLWTVNGSDEQGRRVSGAAEFRVIGAPLQARLDALSAEAARAHGIDARGDAPEDVLFALALEQAGLANDAQRQWDALARARPAFAAPRQASGP